MVIEEGLKEGKHINKTMDMNAIKSMKGGHESEASWQRRKKFLIVCQSRYPKGQLITLSYCYVNVLLYGCRYSEELMDDLYERACDVANYPWEDPVNMSRWNEIFEEKQGDLNFYAPKKRETGKRNRKENNAHLNESKEKIGKIGNSTIKDKRDKIKKSEFEGQTTKKLSKLLKARKGKVDHEAVTGKKGHGLKAKLKVRKAANITSGKIKVISAKKKHKDPTTVTKKIVYDTLKSILAQSSSGKDNKARPHDSFTSMNKIEKSETNNLGMNEKQVDEVLTSLMNSSKINSQKKNPTVTDENVKYTFEKKSQVRPKRPEEKQPIASNPLVLSDSLDINNNISPDSKKYAFKQSTTKSSPTQSAATVFSNKARHKYSIKTSESMSLDKKHHSSFKASDHKPTYKQKQQMDKSRKQQPFNRNHGCTDSNMNTQGYPEYPTGHHYDRYLEYIRFCTSRGDPSTPFPSYEGNMWGLPKSGRFHDSGARFPKRQGHMNKGQSKSPPKNSFQVNPTKTLNAKKHYRQLPIQHMKEGRQRCHSTESEIAVGDINNNERNQNVISQIPGGVCHQRKLPEKEYVNKTEMLESILNQIHKT